MGALFQSLFGLFSSPWTLLWLSAAAAPILIHLWNRRKFREETWAAIEFLLAAMKKNSRRIQIEHLILLAVRTLLVILLVTALARPLVRQFPFAMSGSERTLHVLVIDGTFSMGYKPTDKSRFDRAKQVAAQIVERASPGDGFALLLISAPPRAVVSTPAFEPGDFLEEIDHLKLPHGGGDLLATSRKLEEMLTAVAEQDSRLVRHQVYFITDLGRNLWQPDSHSQQTAAELREIFGRLAGRAHLAVIDLGQNDSENLAVTGLGVAGPFVTVAQTVALEVDLRNFGRQDRGEQLVELIVDGKRVAETRAAVAAGESASVGFTHRFESPGDHQVEARLASDLLEVDNHRYLAVTVKESVRVLCVNSKQPGSADYLTLALDPEYQRVDRPLVRPDVVTESALWETDLGRYDCVFLCNVGRFNRSEAKILRSYLASGGSLVFFLGDRVLPESYNDSLADPSPSGVQLLPAQLVETAPAGSYRFDPLDYRHPVVQEFQGFDRASLTTTPVKKYIRLKVPDDDRSEVMLAIRETGDPAIVGRVHAEPAGEPALSPAGQGHGGMVMVAAFPVSLASKADADTGDPWTTLPITGSFMPIVHGMLAHALGHQKDDRNVTVGQALGGTVRLPAVDASLSVTRPDGQTETVRPRAADAQSRWSFDQTDFSGTYEVQLGEPVAERRLYGVNVDTAESDLTKLDPDDLKTISDRLQLRTQWQDAGAEVPLELPSPGTLHHWLLYAVLGLLFLETGLACWFGNRSA